MLLRILTIFFIVITGISYGQSRTTRKSADTLFKKTITGSGKIDTCHVVYIERDTNASCYKWLENTSDVEAMWKEKKPGEKAGANNKGLPMDWCRVRLYKRKPYMYAPCDWIAHGITSIRGNVIIDGNGSDLGVEEGIFIRKISSQLYEVRKAKKQEKARTELRFSVHIIDTVRNIAIFEYPGENGRANYELMIDMRHVRSLPAIVNHCSCQKVVEFKLDDPNEMDFRQSIKQNRIIIK